MAHYKGAASEGTRAQNLLKKREKAKEEFESLRRKIEDGTGGGGALNAVGGKFAASYDLVEEKLKSSTVGLMTLDEMKMKHESLVKERELELAAAQAALSKAERDKKAKRLGGSGYSGALSFQYEEEEEEEDSGEEEERAPVQEEGPPLFKKRKMGKNPNVDTSFLPDRDREEEESRKREELRQDWLDEQNRLKSEEVRITYSYWDGSGHRRTVVMKKGNTIYDFLQKCLEMLRKDFSELKTVTADQLMYIKEDLIIPQHYSFYDFIVNKARGKSGPLFAFDVHEDVRMINDAKVEKDESHAGKVVMRNWYERNKHIFPASRWEAYDPERKWDKYTISDGPKPK